MYHINLTKIVNGKQYNELILKTKNKHKADLAFEGTLLGLRYKLKDKRIGEIVLKNKVKFKYENTVITVTLKED